LRGVRKRKKPFPLWHAPFLPPTLHNPPQRLIEVSQRLHPLTPRALDPGSGENKRQTEAPMKTLTRHLLLSTLSVVASIREPTVLDEAGGKPNVLLSVADDLGLRLSCSVASTPTP
jgi:hypothetical protein